MPFVEPAALVFWLAEAAMIHTYFGYPVSLRFFKRRYPAVPPVQFAEWPSVDILIPARNEERDIARKIESCLALDYDSASVRIVVGSDASRDRTVEICRRYADANVRTVEFEKQVGKSEVLNRLAQSSDAEILVFTDANALAEPGTLRQVVRHFADTSVGAVSAAKSVQILQGAANVRGEAAYSEGENRLKARESCIGGMSGCRGAFVAIRRTDFDPFPPGTINDDVVLGIRAVLSGQRVVLDMDARVSEPAGATVAEEFARRVRIGAGNAQALVRYPRVLSPRYGVAAYTFFSHKVLRWIFPFLAVAALASNAFLLDHSFYRWTFAFQICGFLAAMLGGMADSIRLHVPVISSLYHFAALNVALGIGFLSYPFRHRSAAWARTPRHRPD